MGASTNTISVRAAYSSLTLTCPSRCPVCGQQAPDMKTMQIHHENKHPKLPWEQDKVVDMHALVGVTTQGVAVQGSKKKK